MARLQSPGYPGIEDGRLRLMGGGDLLQLVVNLRLHPSEPLPPLHQLFHVHVALQQAPGRLPYFADLPVGGVPAFPRFFQLRVELDAVEEEAAFFAHLVQNFALIIYLLFTFYAKGILLVC